MSNLHRNIVLVITDKVDGPLTNGSQVMARAVMAELSRWFTLRIIVRQDEVQPSPWMTDQVALIYNFGCTAYSSELTATIHSLAPAIPVINHFQLVLSEYAHQEGYEPAESIAMGQASVSMVELGTCNIFPSFSELNRVIRLNWPIQQADNRVIRNAFVPAPGGAEVTTAPASLRLMAAGRFSDYVKGADLLYRAFRSYYAVDPDAHLYIAGDEPRFSQLLRDLPATAWTFLGWLGREDLHAWLAEVDLLVVPSRYEPFGLIAVEAMAMGTPVIAMEVGGLAEIIHHGVTGWLSDPKEGSQGLKQALIEAAEQKNRLPQMGRMASSRIEAGYSLTTMVSEIKQLFDNILYKNELISY